MGIYVASWYLNTLYLRCFLVCHCEILFIMSQLHFSRFLKNVFLIALEILCLLVRSNYARKYDTILRVGSSFWITFLWYICITCWNKVTVRLSLWRTFIASKLRYLFFQMITFLMTSELCWIMETVETCE